jgi:hypothetical protein
MSQTFAQNRDALHRIAEDVVSPARVKATGNEIALEATPGGFGTPPFPDGGQVRVEGAELVTRTADGAETREPIDDVDPEHSARVARFFAFTWGVLETLAKEAREPSEIHLWPEHFDIAFEDQEVTYGGSPGDENHAEPYFYVAPWTKPDPAPEWNAVGFNGAEAPWTDEAAALAFFRERREALCRPSTGS